MGLVSYRLLSSAIQLRMPPHAVRCAGRQVNIQIIDADRAICLVQYILCIVFMNNLQYILKTNNPISELYLQIHFGSFLEKTESSEYPLAHLLPREDLSSLNNCSLWLHQNPMSLLN
ncbi:hypothetical protein DYP60_01100 [Sphaerochaeta halotolerans]|uniref:Uncharacterized protein n=1 Tax=Sphaerochaeta halotolerans TaxID=2293840 RepID=A0A372MLG0_9SPIR|nr:hypothetical protein DYP60_01100 [Sphaerochaeta halotolerans]